MRRIVALLFFSALLSCGPLQAQTPTVDQVLQHFVTALGGRTELEKIHTMLLRGSLELPEFGAQGTTVEYFEYPDHFAAISEIVGHGSSKTVYDGHEGWQVDPANKITELAGPELADVQRRANIHWNLKLHEFYPNIQVQGREAVNGEDAWKLEASLEGVTYDFYFSQKTGLLIRFDSDPHVENGSSSVSIRDYRPVGKVLFAFGAAQTAGPVKWTRKLSEVKFNEPIEPSVFARPARTPSK